MRQDIQLRCRYCQAIPPGWLRVFNHPNGAMLLNHLSMMHPDQVGPYLERMRTEDIGTVAWELARSRYGLPGLYPQRDHHRPTEEKTAWG